MEEFIGVKAYTSKECDNTIHNLCIKYNFIKKICFGSSASGKKLYALRLGESKDSTLFVASVHGNEYITTTLLLMFINDICNSVSKKAFFCGIDFCRALRQKSIVFIPMLNPDGCDIAQNYTELLPTNKVKMVNQICGGNYSKWKANLNGVDINHNFPADWERLKSIEKSRGILTYSCGMFGGFSAASEPETVALMTLCRLIKPSSAIALHTQGEVIYYGYNKYNRAETQMAEIFSMLSGYALSTPDYLSSCGGFKDWFSCFFNKPGFTVECGFGCNPLPISDAVAIYKKIKEMLAVAAIM